MHTRIVGDRVILQLKERDPFMTTELRQDGKTNLQQYVILFEPFLPESYCMMSVKACPRNGIVPDLVSEIWFHAKRDMLTPT